MIGPDASGNDGVANPGGDSNMSDASYGAEGTQGTDNSTVGMQQQDASSGLIKQPVGKAKGQLRFRDKNPIPIGIAGIAASALAVTASLQYDAVPVINGKHGVTAYFADAGGLNIGDSVKVAGMKMGSVKNISIDDTEVKVEFDVDTDVVLGEDTSAEIKTDSILGKRALHVFSDGSGDLKNRLILSDKTSTPYSLTDALGDLSQTVDELDSQKVNDALDAVSENVAGAAPEFKGAITGVSRLSQSLNTRDEALKELIERANSVSGVLSKRSDQVNQLIIDGNVLFAELDLRKRAINELLVNISALSKQLTAVIKENEAQLKPALEKLDTISGILLRNKENVGLGLKRIAPFATALGEAVASGPFFNAYISNLSLGHLTQPILDGAVGSLGGPILPPSNREPEMPTRFKADFQFERAEFGERDTQR